MFIYVVAPPVEAYQLAKVNENQYKLNAKMAKPLVSIILHFNFERFGIYKEHY